jgi:hypothetical protein
MAATVDHSGLAANAVAATWARNTLYIVVAGYHASADPRTPLYTFVLDGSEVRLASTTPELKYAEMPIDDGQGAPVGLSLTSTPRRIRPDGCVVRLHFTKSGTLASRCASGSFD